MTEKLYGGNPLSYWRLPFHRRCIHHSPGDTPIRLPDFNKLWAPDWATDIATEGQKRPSKPF